jgi:pyridoxine 5'-phosphate synthase PdxJ
VENPLQKRLRLEEREKKLHEQLAEDTRRLQNARVQVKLCEDALERTIKELTEIRAQRNELTELLEGVWNGPASSQRKNASV